MSISSYERTFGLRTLAGMVELFAREESMSRAALSLFEANGRRVDPQVDGSFEWDERRFSRHLAPVVGRDSPAVSVTPIGTIVRNSAPAHIRVSKFIPAHKLHGDRGPGSLAPNARLIVDQEVRDLAKVIANTREYLAMRALFGSVVVSNATIPGTKVPFTLSFGLNTYTASSDWSAPSSPILTSELTAAKLDYMQAIGMNPAQCLMGQTVGDYLRGNSGVVNLLQQQYGQQLARSAAELFGPWAEGLQLGGLQWSITEEGYVPEGGSFTRYIPAADKVAMLPASGDLVDVLGVAEGYGIVPAMGGDVLPLASAEGATQLAPSRGSYVYARRILEPLGVEIIQGWIGLYVILTPNGICVLDVVP